MSNIKPLPIKDQIECFEWIRKQYVERSYLSLVCLYGLHKMWLYQSPDPGYAACFQTTDLFPLFTAEKADTFGVDMNKNHFFFPLSNFDLINILQFLTWILDELNKKK